MSDTEDNNQHAEEIWEDLVELDEIPDGPTTLFVGGFSRYKTINEALEGVLTSNDRIVLLDHSSQDGDVTVDTTRYCGVTIVSACPRNTLEPPRILGEDEEIDGAANDDELLDEEELLRRQKAAKVKKDTTIGNFVVHGKLILQRSEPNESSKLPTGFPEVEEEDGEADGRGGRSNGDDDDENEGGGNNNNYDGDEDGEEGGGKAAPRPLALTINGINFTDGVIAESLSNAYVEDCGFGTLAFQPNSVSNNNANDINTRVHGLSTVEFSRCQFFGSNKAAIYCYPHSRAKFIDCDVHGARRPLTANEIAALNAKKPRGYVPLPPPPPAVPKAEDVCCATGIFADDSSAIFTNVTVENVGIGLYAAGPSKGLRIEDSEVKQCNTVGVLFDNNCGATAKSIIVTLCGRECAVFGAGHPTVRECTFVGDVRLKARCEATGITDNIVGNNGVVVNEDTQFHIKGFQQVPHDPTVAKKPKKAND